MKLTESVLKMTDFLIETKVGSSIQDVIAEGKKGLKDEKIEDKKKEKAMEKKKVVKKKVKTTKEKKDCK